MFEPVEMPKELQKCPRYDFRVNFKHKLAQLAEHLKGGKARHDNIPLHYRSIRFKVQHPVMITVLALLVLPITLFFAAIWLFIENSPEFSLILLAFTYITARPALNLLRRKILFREMRLNLFLHSILMLFVVFPDLLSSLANPTLINLILFLASLYLFVITFSNMQGWIPILSWFGVEDSDDLQALREKYHGQMIAHIDRETTIKRDRKDALKEETYAPGIYSLFYVDADRGFANNLRHQLERRKVTEQHAGARESAMPLLIISDKTRDADVRGWLESDTAKNPVFVVIEEFELSPEIEQKVMKYQYFDMRRDNTLEYNTLAGYIKGDNFTTSLNITPDSLKKIIRSTPVNWLRWSLVISGAYMLFHSFLIDSDSTWVAAQLAEPVIITSFLLGVIQLIFAMLVGTRRINYRYFNIMFGLASMVILTYALPTQESDLSTNGLVAIIFFIPFLVILWAFYRKSYWLPR